MRILFDHGTPRGLQVILTEHSVATARQMGWEKLSNGELLRTAEDAGFELLLTTDRRIQYQQNLSSRRIALLVLTGTTKWTRVRLHVARIAEAVKEARPSSYVEILIPYSPPVD